MRGAYQLQENSNSKIEISITTNGTLADIEMASILQDLGVQVCVSLDGPRAVHDSARIDRKGNGSYDAVISGIECLRRAGLDPTALCVGKPSANARELLAFFANDLGFRVVDFLLPDFNHVDRQDGQWHSMATFLCELFDAWYDEFSHRGIRVRLLEAMVASVLGRRSGLQGVGFSPMSVLCVNSDGSLENHDALRISGESSVKTGLNVLSSPIDALFTNRIWRKPYDASISLPKECSDCDIRRVCRGGDVIHRYQGTNYDSPSVYCDDYLRIYPHIAKRVREDLMVAVPVARNPTAVTPQPIQEL